MRICLSNPPKSKPFCGSGPQKFRINAKILGFLRMTQNRINARNAKKLRMRIVRPPPIFTKLAKNYVDHPFSTKLPKCRRRPLVMYEIGKRSTQTTHFHEIGKKLCRSPIMHQIAKRSTGGSKLYIFTYFLRPPKTPKYVNM